MSEQPAGKRAGRVMLVLAWGAALLLATQFFADWEEGRRNPNRAPESQHGNGYVEVNLASGRQGHYMAGGKINAMSLTSTGQMRLRAGTGISGMTFNSQSADLDFLTSAGSIVSQSASAATQMVMSAPNRPACGLASGWAGWALGYPGQPAPGLAEPGRPPG